MNVKIVHEGNNLYVLDMNEYPVMGRFDHPIFLTYGDLITYEEARRDIVKETLRLGHVIQEIEGSTSLILSTIAYILK